MMAPFSVIPSLACGPPPHPTSQRAPVLHAAHALLLLLAILILPACTGNKPTRVVMVGGAGLSQLGDLGAAIAAQCPDTDVVETGGWDGFRGDPKIAATQPPCQGVVLIGHSFGCQTVLDAAAHLRGVDVVILIDPSWDDMTVPRNIRSCIWYQRSEEAGMERRSIIRGAGHPVIIAGDHNAICHNPRLIAEVTRIVKNLSERRALQQRLRTQVR